MRSLIFIFLFLILNTVDSYGAKILGVFHVYSKSHHMIGEAILKELARRGHEVTMISAHPLKEPFPNYTDIFMPELLNPEMEELMEYVSKGGDVMTLEKLDKIGELSRQLTEVVFANKEFKKLVENKTKFDLVIMDMHLNEAHLVLGRVFNAPIIPCSSMGSNDFVARLTGNHIPYAYVPMSILPFSDEMNFLERLMNTLANLIIEHLADSGLKSQQEIIEKHFPNFPKIEELIQDVAVVFTNSHFTWETPRPYVPKVVNVGGCHIQPTKQLPSRLKKYLDEAKEGVIFFSLGSNVKTSSLNDATIQNILNALERSNLKVLMKFEEDLPKKFQNILAQKWLPQSDILAHPNVRLFVTHGGLMSIIETIHHGIPIIGIPFFGDQFHNINQVVRAGYGLRLDLADITEESFLDSIKTILSHSSFTEQAKLKSELFRNQPMKPLDAVAYWCEHVIKHKGAEHLNTKAHQLSWYQLYLLDVVFLLATVVVALFALFYSIIKVLLYYCKTFKKSSNIKQEPQSKKDN